MDGLSVPSHGLKLLSGTANRGLAEEIARHLGIELCRVNLGRFADGEIAVRIDENVRGNDVFIIQPTNPPADNLMEMLLLVDAARRASAARSEEHTSELQSHSDLVCRLLLEKKNQNSRK